MRVRLSTDAYRDRHEAQAYYRSASRAAAAAFRRELDRALRYVIEYPAGAPRRERDIRGKRLEHFPYTILYRVVGGTIFVLAIAHQARDPEYYANRLP